MMGELMSQNQLEEKYDIDRCVFSLAMNAAGVQAAGISQNKYQVKLYREEEAVAAVSQLFLMRKENHVRKAEEWQRASDEIWEKFRNGMEG